MYGFNLYFYFLRGLLRLIDQSNKHNSRLSRLPMLWCSNMKLRSSSAFTINSLVSTRKYQANIIGLQCIQSAMYSVSGSVI